MKRWPFVIVLLFSFIACEKVITIDLPEAGQKIVIEASIENGAPPLVILTRNTSLFGNSLSQIDELLVHGASVSIISDGQTTQLQEVCLSSLPDSLKAAALQLIGIELDSAVVPDYCLYTNVGFSGIAGKTYDLRVEADGHVLTARTQIPGVVPITEIFTLPVKGSDSTRFQLLAGLTDPDTLGNRYRYFTSVNGGPFYPGYFGSVFDDELINGLSLTSPFEQGAPRHTTRSFESIGQFDLGDTIVLKFSAIDRAHYDFWRSIEEQFWNGGPFGAPTVILSNISGGLGIWGGYGSSVDTVIAQ